MFKYTALFYKPGLFGLVMAITWRFTIYPIAALLGEDIQTSSSIATGFFALALFLPGFVVAQALSTYREMSGLLHVEASCDEKTDPALMSDYLKRFTLAVATKTPGLMYLVIGIISFISIGLTALIHFQSAWYGAIAVFATSFVKYLLLMCAFELDDPFTGRFVTKVPVKWKEACDKLPENKKFERFAKIFL